MKKHKLKSILISTSVITFMYVFISALLDLKDREKELKQKFRDDLSSVILIQDFVRSMPSVSGAIQFQSFGQLDSIFERVLSEYSALDGIAILDESFNVVHSYDAQGLSGVEWGAADFPSEISVIENSIYLSKIIEAKNNHRLIFKIDISKLLNKEPYSSFGKVDDFKIVLTTQKREGHNVHLRIKTGGIQSYLFRLYMKHLLSYIVLFIAIFGACYLVAKWLIYPFKELLSLISSLAANKKIDIEVSNYPRIFKPFFLSILKANSEILNSLEKARLFEIQQTKFELARQVAHDIRSPIEVLKTLKSDNNYKDSDLGYAVDMALSRVEEIAFNLLQSIPNIQSSPVLKDTPHLPKLLSDIVLEKKIEHKGNSKVEIIELVSEDVFCSFSNISPGQLKRVISNIINNSVEAFNDKSGVVEVSLKVNRDRNLISIKDNGPGLNHELVEMLNSGNQITTKKTGNGLGFSGSRNIINAYNGNIYIHSKPNSETEVIIDLPRVEVPKDFLSSINVTKFTSVIVIDDDIGFHQVWKHRFRDLEIKLEFYQSPEEFQSALRCESVDNTKTLYLCDYEFQNSSKNGIDFLKSIDCLDAAVIVSGRAEEQNLIEVCSSLGVKLISKRMINVIPIKDHKRSRIVLIDNDKLIHYSWNEVASKYGISLLCYKSLDEFLLHAKNVELSSFIFVDSDLGGGLKGEIESERIFNLGYTKIFLSTGFAREDISKPPWIMDIFPKRLDDILINL